MAESFQERSEAATPHRREEMRKQGRVAQSRELVIVASLLVLVITFYVHGAKFVEECQKMMRWWLLSASDVDWMKSDIRELLKPILWQCASAVWPFFLIAAVVGVLVHIGQIGVLFTTETLMPDWGRINPLSGIQKYFSLRGAIETLKSLVKFTIIGWTGYVQFQSVARQAVRWSTLSVQEQLLAGCHAVGQFALTIVIILLALAVVDFIFQKFEYERSLRMTKQEVKEETKMREGDPMIRARVRSIQRERANKRMMKDVQKADAVITNPTHFAVAIKYDPGSMHAPRVIAKGADYVALRIKEVATRHAIPIVENKPLARILYRTLKVGSFVPRELYHAVAEVLAYVYKLKRRWNEFGIRREADENRAP